MASTSMKAAAPKSILKPVTTLMGHGKSIRSISYFPDGQRMISGSWDKTTRQWDLKTGKEIEEAREVCEEWIYAVGTSRDGRWVITGGDYKTGKLKACEMGIMKIFEGQSRMILCIDISTDSMLLASGSEDGTARIWNLDTGKLVAGPFCGVGFVGAVRFSTDSKKLAVRLDRGTCLEVWDVQSQKLDVRIGEPGGPSGVLLTPVFWTNKNKTIIAVFDFTKAYRDVYSEFDHKTIYEFDASTLETVGAPFEGHTETIFGLALSFDCTLLASTSRDATIKLWAVESRQLLASFDLQNSIDTLVLSPDSRQLAYTSNAKDDCKICICDIPPDVLAQARTIARKKSTLNDLLNSNATCRPPAGHHRPPISAMPVTQRAPPTIDPRQSTFLRLSKLLRFSPRTNAVRPDWNYQPRDPLDFPVTLPLPPNRLHGESLPSTTLPGGRAFFNPIQPSSGKGKQKAREPNRRTAKVVDVPFGQATYADVVGVDDGTRPYILFFCLSWFQKKEKKKPDPRPVYDDELEDDEEEENIVDRVVVPPPRVQHEEIELKTVATQSQPEAGPSRLAVPDEHLETLSS